MSFSSGGTGGLPSKYQNALGVQSYRASSSESARPIPYVAGKQRVALTFISDVFDTKTTDVGGGGKGATRTGTNYYTSFAALACHGPVDALHAIYLNGDPVYTETTNIVIRSLTRANGIATALTKNAHNLTTGESVVIVGAEQQEYLGTHVITVTDATHFTYPVSGTPVTPATSPNKVQIIARVLLPAVFRDNDNPDYVDITIPDYGVMRLYWGTETQSADDYLRGSGVSHPSYRGFCYAVFHQLFLGFNQTNVQNVELILGRYPERDWIGSDDINEDSGIVQVIADWLQNPRLGLNIDSSQIDTATMIATAAQLEVEGLGFSPIVTREQEARQLISSALEYCDGYLAFTDDGKISVRLIRSPEGTLPEISDSDLVDKPTFDGSDWGSVFNETRVKFNNRLLDYKEDSIGRADSGARSITGEPHLQTLDRAWITNTATAEAIQRAASLAGSIPKLSGKLKLRYSADLFDSLQPGSAFTLNYSNRNTANIVFRVESRSIQSPAQPEFEITFNADRSYLYT